MKFIFSMLIICCIVFISSCYYDKEDLLYGNVNSGPCTDTTAIVSYSQKVVPMLQQQCYSCHTGSFPSGGIVMGTYATDKAIGQNGKLYGSVNYSSGFSPMPKGMPKMSNCQIATIKKWIDAGMPNN
jgi:mono/diheme cytochrome c family protein